MNTLKAIKIGWKQLAVSLNDLVTAVNARTIIRGHGIDISETPGGVMISVQSKDASTKPGSDETNSQKGDDGTDGTSDGDTAGRAESAPNGTANWIRINVVFDNGGSYTMKEMYVWGTQPF